MTCFTGRPVVRGRGSGPLLSTDQPVNFTAAFTKVRNIVPRWRAEVRDRHHPWFRTNIAGKVLAVPACVGSTHTGLVLLDLVRLKAGPAAIIVDRADTLLVSGIVLSEVWYDRSVPVVEYPTGEIRGLLSDGEMIEVDGDNGTITHLQDT
jgi:hypothetical protein